MKHIDKSTMRTNINNTADKLASCIGSDTVCLYLRQHFGVSSPDQLADSDLDRAFDDLDYMLSEQR